MPTGESPSALRLKCFPPPQSVPVQRSPPLSPDIPEAADRGFPKTPISAKLLLTARANRVRQGQAGRSRLVLKRTAPSGSGESRDELGEPRGNRLAVSSGSNVGWRTESGTGERSKDTTPGMVEGTFSNEGTRSSSSGSGSGLWRAAFGLHSGPGNRSDREASVGATRTTPFCRL